MVDLWTIKQQAIHVDEASSSVDARPYLLPTQNCGCEPRPVCRPSETQAFMAMEASMEDGSVTKRMVG